MELLKDHPVETEVDIAIVGGGVAGCIAAVQLSRAGHRVALFDLAAEPRPEFKAEQLVGAQIGRLADLGLLGAMTAESTLMPEAVNGRFGHVIDRTRVDQYGVPYGAMVTGLRSCLPDAVRFIDRRVSAIDTGPDVQTVTYGSGETLRTRLVVLATGLSSVLPKRLGIDYTMIRAAQSLAIGFDVELVSPGTTLPLVYYGEDPEDQVDYVAFFPMHDVVRANLFCYHDQGSDWVRDFCREPSAALRQALPGLFQIIRRLTVTSPVQVRSNDLRVARDPARDGLVLIGDSFQTPCPAAGTGIDRLLSDIDTLCTRYMDGWLATPGMGRDKIAAFYADPDKIAFDAECIRIANYRRAVSTRQSLWWTVHRKQVFFRRRLRALLAQRPGRAAPPTMAPSL